MSVEQYEASHPRVYDCGFRFFEHGYDFGMGWFVSDGDNTEYYDARVEGMDAALSRLKAKHG